MTNRKQIMVTLSGEDLTKFDEIVAWLKKINIFIPNAEVLKMALRGYYNAKLHEKINMKTSSQKEEG